MFNFKPITMLVVQIRADWPQSLPKTLYLLYFILLSLNAVTKRLNVCTVGT